MKPLIFAVALLPFFFAQTALAGSVAPAPPESAYIMIDAAIVALNKSVDELGECVNVAEYLLASATKSAKLTKTPDDAVPSHMAKLAPFKFKVAESKRVACLLQGNELSVKADETMTMLASFEPRSAKGLAPRRVKIQGQRAKANAYLARLGAKPAKSAKAKGDANAEPAETPEP